MRKLLTIMLLAVALATGVTQSAYAVSFGALAIDSNHGYRSGVSYGQLSVADADYLALAGCGPGCYIVSRFNNTCAAFVADRQPGSMAAGLGYSPSQPIAIDIALRFCWQSGGINCQLRVGACSLPY